MLAVCSADGAVQDREASRNSGADWMTPLSKQGGTRHRDPARVREWVHPPEEPARKMVRQGPAWQPCARLWEAGPGSPLDSCPAERLDLDGGQRLRSHMGPHSPAQLGPAEEAADIRPLKEGKGPERLSWERLAVGSPVADPGSQAPDFNEIITRIDPE